MGTSERSHSFSLLQRDHPHACGDKSLQEWYDSTRAGSSPRVWGQVSGCIMSGAAVRIIPTRVGTRLPPTCSNSLTRDHPHACGDKVDALVDNADTLGSSPRVWGQGKRSDVVASARGIIPTRVGTSRSGRNGRRNVEDHPHACGDKYAGLRVKACKKGSSPRVWGQDKFCPIGADMDRIIPTRVGTSGKIPLFTTLNWDHPHACGDK